MSYNGWTNYATWRVNLEVLDGLELDTWLDVNDPDMRDPKVVADILKEHVEYVVFESAGVDSDSLVASYAEGFLADVDYYELAEHYIADLPDLEEEEDEEE